MLIAAPIAAMVSHTINALGIHFNLWHYQPFDLKEFATLPLNLGYFALAGCLIVYFIKALNLNAYLIMFLASITLTFFEFLAITAGLLIYDSGWNYVYTIVSYYLAYILVYWYYLQVTKFLTKEKDL